MSKRVRYVWLVYPDPIEEVLRSIRGTSWRFIRVTEMYRLDKLFGYEAVVEAPEDEEAQVLEKTVILMKTYMIRNFHRERTD